MRIGVDLRHITRGNQSGVGQYTLETLRSMVEEYPEDSFTLLTTGSKQARWNAEKNLGETLTKKNIKHVHAHIPNRLLNILFLFFHYPKIDTLFKDDQLDVIWDPNINFTAHGATRYIITFHDLSFELLKKSYTFKRRLWHSLVAPKQLAKNAHKIIVPSKTTKTDLNAIYEVSEDKISVIPHGVGESFTPRPIPQDHGIRSRYNLPKNFILHVGTTEPRKNIPTLIEGYKEAMTSSSYLRREDFHLVIAGTNTCKSRQQDPHIHFTGYIPNEHLPTLYRLSKLLAYTSLYEGFGLPILEAFATNTPVITSHTSSLLEIGGPAAVYIDPYNYHDIAKAIQSVLEDPELIEHLVSEGQKRLFDYSWSRTAKETMAALTTVLQ
ncbi:MAG: glycosyltransferase family 1 protein [bacterium]|nr:glycosyltransferase family 1 protein [bacterium]